MPVMNEANRKRWTLAAMCFALFMVMLDNTVVNIALPALQADLHATINGVQWVVESYALFLAALLVLVYLQIRASVFRPWLYWATIVASTTAGTTMADFADRSLGIGYAGGALLLLGCVLVSLWLWKRTQGSISLAVLRDPKSEAFYWLTITFSQTLGTALGDWMADDTDSPHACSS